MGDEAVDAWVDETSTTALLVQIDGETVAEIDRPTPDQGWVGPGLLKLTRGSVHVAAINWLNSWIDDQAEVGDEEEEGFDPGRLAVCAYWRCGELFERWSANHRYCRKACRSRQNKWQRAQARKTRT